MRDFATELQSRGVNVVLDQLYFDANPSGPPNGWPRWSRDQAILSDLVIIIGNDPWFRCFDGRESPGTGLGAACEASILQQRIYDLGYNQSIVRIVYFDDADILNVPIDLKGYHHFHAVRNFNDILRWVGVSAIHVAPNVSTSLAKSVNWPARCGDFAPNMANRHEEFDFFADEICGATSKRALLVRAESGSGKSRFVKEMLRYGEKVFGQGQCSLVDFKSGSTVDHFLDTLDLDLRLPSSGRSPSALRKALRESEKPILLVIDTFERAPEDTRAFIEAHVLADLPRAPSLRVLLAGQPRHFPDLNASTWGDHAHRFDFGFIPDPEPWISWAKRFELVTPDMVRTIVAVTKGAPSDTANLIAKLGTYDRSDFHAMGFGDFQ